VRVHTQTLQSVRKTCIFSFLIFGYLKVVLEMAEGGDPITFEEWSDRIGITRQGKEKLEKATVCSLLAVKCLSEEDIQEIRLGVGDRGLFRAGWNILREPIVSPKPTSEIKGTGEEDRHSVPQGVAPPPVDPEAKIYSVADVAKFLGQSSSVAGAVIPSIAEIGRDSNNSGRVSSRAASAVTVRTLAKDQLLNRLSSQFVQGGLQETLSIQELSLAGLLKGEKALLPVNFVTIFTGCGIDEEEVVGTGQFQGRLVWQSGKNGSPKRPTADRLTYGQFF
jgi:hypothetical protein